MPSDLPDLCRAIIDTLKKQKGLRVMVEEEVPGGWTTEEWTKAWTIHVGKAYKCSACGTIIMCTKGGVGTLEPICCGNDMELVQAPDEIK